MVARGYPSNTASQAAGEYFREQQTLALRRLKSQHAHSWGPLRRPLPDRKLAGRPWRADKRYGAIDSESDWHGAKSQFGPPTRVERRLRREAAVSDPLLRQAGAGIGYSNVALIQRGGRIRRSGGDLGLESRPRLTGQGQNSLPRDRRRAQSTRDPALPPGPGSRTRCEAQVAKAVQVAKTVNRRPTRGLRQVVAPAARGARSHAAAVSAQRSPSSGPTRTSRSPARWSPRPR